MRYIFFLVANLVFLPISLCAEVKVLAFAGSTRADSYNKKLLFEAACIAQQMDAKVTIVDLKNFPMPLYDADLEKAEGMPFHAKRLRDLMLENTAIIIASPQYNASISGVLKNALDWVSRDGLGSGSPLAFQSKRFALMSASPGKKGGAKGLEHLKAIIEDCGGEVIAQQVSLGLAHQAFRADGRVQNEGVKRRLMEQMRLLLQVSE